VELAQTRDLSMLQKALVESDQIQRRLWSLATAHTRREPHSPIMALYIVALNEVFDLHSTRVAVAVHTRIPGGIWLVLFSLVALGMFGVGYQTAVTGSRRSRATPVLALAFSTVIALICSLDRPQSGFITISQQPLTDLRASMAEGPVGGADRTTAKP